MYIAGVGVNGKANIFNMLITRNIGVNSTHIHTHSQTGVNMNEMQAWSKEMNENHVQRFNAQRGNLMRPQLDSTDSDTSFTVGTV